MATQLADFPLRERGFYYEDFEIGRRFDHHWGRTLERYDSTLFSSLTLHYIPLYLNAEYAKQHGKPGDLINPYLVFLLVLGMSVEDTSEGVGGADGAFLGVKEVKFLADVTAGDTLVSSTVVKDRRTSSSRPGHGIVTWQTSGRNQHGEIVLEFERTNLVVRRKPAVTVQEGSLP